MNNFKKIIYNYVIPVVGRIMRYNNRYINVIYYHDIVKECGKSFMRTNINVFKEHMQYLKDKGYQTLRFDDLNSTTIAYNPKTLIIAFDDGWLSNYTEIYSYMKDMGLKYNIYLAIDKIGKDPSFLTWQHVKKMHAEGFVGFGVHTFSHANVSELSKIDPSIEFTKANRVFENYLGFIPLDFCYPYGAYSSESNVYLVNNTPYTRIYTSALDYSYGIGNKVIFGRNGISNEEPFTVFKSKVKGYHNIMGKLSNLLR